MKKQFVTIISIVGLILCSIGGYLGYTTAKNTLDKDFLSLNQRIDDLFHGKDIIQDGHAETLSGEDTKYGYNIYLGGFTIHRLSKESGGFVKSKLTAGNITWLKDKYEYDPIYWNNKRPTYRPEPEDAYQRAFTYLLTGTEKEPNLAFTRETFTEIKDFPGSFSAEYYNIIQTKHPTESYLRKNGSWQFNYDTYKLSYNETKEFYAIILDEAKAKALTIKFSLFGLGFGLLATFILSLLMRFFIPNTEKGESIFNKKWKNIETNSIIIIEPKLFGKIIVTLIENEKIKRGLAKITENGASIHLSFSESEIFYWLNNLTNQKLEMTNLATNNLVKFELLGSNAFKQNYVAQEIKKNDTSNKSDIAEPLS
jgi:hypothetical protein